MGNITMVDGHVPDGSYQNVTANGSCPAMPACDSTVCVPAARSMR